MILGIIGLSVIIGGTVAVVALISGYSALFALVIYSSVGVLSALSLATGIFIISIFRCFRNRSESSDAIVNPHLIARIGMNFLSQ